MDIQDKSTGLSKMPLNIVHDENIEQDDISHVYYEIKSGVENTSFLFLVYQNSYFKWMSKY